MIGTVVCAASLVVWLAVPVAVLVCFRVLKSTIL